MIERLVLIRHAAYGSDGKISSIGREQAEAITPVIKTLIKQANKESCQFIGFITSNETRAVDTALVIGDKLGGLDTLNTFEDPSLDMEGVSASSQFCDLLEKRNLSGLMVAVGHKALVECVPYFLVKEKGWNQSQQFKSRDYCTGYYYDFQAKTYKLVPEDISLP